MIDFLSVEEVVAIHADQIARYGGSDGIRDGGLLESAVFRPCSGYHDTLIDMAAALWQGLTLNHAFVDGNKRVGFAAVYTFLRINGVQITAGPDITLAFILESLEQRQFRADRLATWLRSNTAPISDSG